MLWLCTPAPREMMICRTVIVFISTVQLFITTTREQGFCCFSYHDFSESFDHILLRDSGDFLGLTMPLICGYDWCLLCYWWIWWICPLSARARWRKISTTCPWLQLLHTTNLVQVDSVPMLYLSTGTRSNELTRTFAFGRLNPSWHTCMTSYNAFQCPGLAEWPMTACYWANQGLVRPNSSQRTFQSVSFFRHSYSVGPADRTSHPGQN